VIDHDALMLVDTDDEFELPAAAEETEADGEEEESADERPLFG